MIRSGAVQIGKFLMAGFAVLGTAGPANAGSTATRCDAQGCVHIHCNATGDRCYRYADGLSALGERGFPREAGMGDRHSVCDHDGDRCYPSPGHRWNFREYYRRHGYRWDDEGH